MSTPVAIWLVPRREDGVELEAVIAGLSEPRGAPRFRPHVTLWSGPCDLGDAEIREVLRAAPQVRRLAVAGVEHGPGRFMAVYLRLEESAALAELRRHLDAGLGPDARPPEVPPHASLIYLEMSGGERLRIARELARRPPAPAIRFDAFAIVRPAPDDRGDVARWRIADVPMRCPEVGGAR